MPRPARTQWVKRNYARRRHRIWMYAMTLATIGWGCWWVALALKKLAPSLAPSFNQVATTASVFAIAGLALALLTVRAKRSWLLFAAVALFANASLLFLPWLARGLTSAGNG